MRDERRQATPGALKLTYKSPVVTMRMESPLNQLAQSIIYCMIGYLIFSVEVSEKLIIGPSQAQQTWVHFMGATRRKVFTDMCLMRCLDAFISTMRVHWLRFLSPEKSSYGFLLIVSWMSAH